jgi:hypothetical protein
VSLGVFSLEWRLFITLRIKNKSEQINKFWAKYREKTIFQKDKYHNHIIIGKCQSTDLQASAECKIMANDSLKNQYTSWNNVS